MKKYLPALGLALMLAAILALGGCGEKAVVSAKDLMSGVQGEAVAADVDLQGPAAARLADFAVKLGQLSLAGEKNPLVSPLSVLNALAMTANGAQAETLSQMEAVFGLSLAELNDYLHAYGKALPAGEKYRVNLANSIWFREGGFTPDQDFLETNGAYYHADLYQAPFDESTLEDINNWVKTETQGLIGSILSQIPPDAVMYLINALAFDAEWQQIYREDQVREGVFTTEAGQRRQVKLMSSTEGRYLEDGLATGFIKYYAERKYAFVALLPNDGVKLDDYLASLSGARLLATLNDAAAATVDADLPKFESDYSLEMSGLLKALGIMDAFDPDLADFSGLGAAQAGNLYISQVLHKTYIAVDEQGTKAGAATAVEVETTSMPMDVKTVTLDRPFVYLLIDCATNLPLFIGTVTDIGA